ncbi:MAG: SIMPL domain-containing protein [Lachnospiraceae bacterium]|nr:SIMPL domain-containing protein [Lachnospiraceae bacterium]
MKNGSRFIIAAVFGAALFTVYSVSAFAMTGTRSMEQEPAEAGAELSGSAEEITVTAGGEGIVYDTPDLADITFSIQTEDKTASAAQEKNNETVDAVLNVLHEAGVEDKNIKTRGYDLYPTYDYSQNTPRLTGYVVTTRIAVTDRTIDETGKLLTAVVAAGANGIDNVSYRCSGYEEDYEEALRKAVAAARRKAEVLAEAAGKELGGVKVITEGFQDTTYRSNTVSRSYAKEMFDTAVEEAAMASVAVMPGEAQITAQVTATFYMK